MRNGTFYIGALALALAMLPAAHAAESDEQAVRGLLAKWVEAGDNQDVTMAEEILHPAAMQYIPHTKAPGGAMTITREQYLGGIRAKKFGGSPRETNIHSIEFDERARNAIAKIEVTSSSMIFYQFVGLSKLADKEWKIVSVLSDIVARQ